MRIDNEKDLEKIIADPEKYEDLIVRQDGEIINALFGHVNALEQIYGLDTDTLYKIISEQDNPQFWLIEHTGCIAVSNKASFGMNITNEQQKVLDTLIQRKIIKNNYFDITENRNLAKALYK